MTHDEIVKLLQDASCYDGRRASEGSTQGWFDAAQRERWTFPEAAEAIKKHYARTTVWIMPGHITERIRADRIDASMRKPIEPAGPPPSGDRLAELIENAFRSIGVDRPAEYRADRDAKQSARRKERP